MRRFSDYRVVDDITAGKAVPRARIEAAMRELNDSIAEDGRAANDAEALMWGLMRSLEAQERELRVLQSALKASGKGA